MKHNKKRPDVGSVKGKNKNTHTVYPFRMRLSIKIRKALDRFFNWLKSRFCDETYREIERRLERAEREAEELREYKRNFKCLFKEE